jgi:hypothetical protein
MWWRTGNTAEASEELLRCFIERVASYFFHDLALTYDRTPVEEVLHGGVIGGLHLRSKNPFWYNGFFRNRKSFLDGILLHSFIVPTEILSRRPPLPRCAPLYYSLALARVFSSSAVIFYFAMAVVMWRK